MNSNICSKIKTRIYLLIIDNRFPFFEKIRAWFVKRMSITSMGNTINISSGVFIEGFNKLKLGNQISINQDCFISAIGGLVIGNNVSIGHRSSILTTEHSFSEFNIPIRNQPIFNLSVEIGDNVWIGANVTILGGVKIADGVVIGAGSVVTKSISESNSIYVGNPARLMKFRTE